MHLKTYLCSGKVCGLSRLRLKYLGRLLVSRNNKSLKYDVKWTWDSWRALITTTNFSANHLNVFRQRKCSHPQHPQTDWGPLETTSLESSKSDSERKLKLGKEEWVSNPSWAEPSTGLLLCGNRKCLRFAWKNDAVITQEFSRIFHWLGVNVNKEAPLIPTILFLLASFRRKPAYFHIFHHWRR